MTITGIGLPSNRALEQHQGYDDIVNVESTEKSAGINNAAIFTGKVDICAGGSCVLVNTGEGGLTKLQIDAFAHAFNDFIRRNPRADLTTSGTAVFGTARGRSKEDEAFARVTAQFVGYILPKGWNDNNSRTILYAGSASELRIPSSTAGKWESSWVRDRTPQTEHTIRLNMSWKDHRTNPSGLARTMIHEYLHRKDEMGFSGGSRVTEEHRKLDEKARNLLEEQGLSGGGCQSVGDSSIPWVAPDYPGCVSK